MLTGYKYPKPNPPNKTNKNKIIPYYSNIITAF